MRDYQLYIDYGDGRMLPGAKSKAKDVLKGHAREHFKMSGYKATMAFEIRLNGTPIERSANNRNWRMRWRPVRGRVAA